MKIIQGYSALYILMGGVFIGSANLSAAVSVPEYQYEHSLKIVTDGLVEARDAMDLGDLDGDGHLDLVTVSRSGAQFLRNEGSPDFLHKKTGSAAISYLTGLVGDKLSFSDVVIKDVNKDTRLDVVASVSDGTNAVFINTGNDSFEIPIPDSSNVKTFTTPKFTRVDIGVDSDVSTSISVADANGDGYPDVVVGNMGAPNKLYLNIGAGAEADPFKDVVGQNISIESYDTIDIEFIDLNRDGFLDVVEVNSGVSSQYQISYSLNNTDAVTPFNFSGINSFYKISGLREATVVEVGDFDKDGYSDFIIGTKKSFTSSDVFYLVNPLANHPLFNVTSIKKPFNADVSAIKLVDVNNDTYLDIVASFNDASEAQNNATQVYLNDKELFPYKHSSLAITVGRGPNEYGDSIVAGDFNSDGKVDIAFGNSNFLTSYYLDDFTDDTTPPEVSISNIVDNAVVLSSNGKSHSFTISALDYSGIESIFVQAFIEDNDRIYGAPIEWPGGWDGLREEPISEITFTNILYNRNYKVEIKVIDKSGNEFNETIEYQYTKTASLVDSDGDKMTDQWEFKNGFDKFDPLDAADDKDKDGLTNVEEFEFKTDPALKDSDFDGYSDLEESVNKTDPLVVNVKPKVNFTVDRYIDEGREVTVDFYLSADAPVYPVTVEVEIGEESTALLGDDYTINAYTHVIEKDRKGSIKLLIADDGLAESRESITLKIKNIKNGLPGVSDKVTLTIVDENMVPSVDLIVTQGSRAGRIVVPDQGLVSLSADIRDVNSRDSHIIDWNFADELGVVQVSNDARSATFDPSGIAPGVYKAELTVTDNGSPNLAVTTYVHVKVVEAGKTGAAVSDDNDNGIVNAYDRVVESYELPVRHGVGAENLMSTLPGLKLSIGATALMGTADDAEVTLEEITAFMESKTSHSLTDEIVNVGGYYDFDVSGLSDFGMTVDIVIPLRVELPRNAVYRKFSPTTGWTDFVQNNSNRVSSAKAENGICPLAGSELYTDGLIPFYKCIQLSIEDGGPNDMDGLANGVIRDPGGVGITPDEVVEEETPEVAAAGGGGGGGSADWFILMIMLFGGVWRIRRFVR